MSTVNTREEKIARVKLMCTDGFCNISTEDKEAIREVLYLMYAAMAANSAEFEGHRLTVADHQKQMELLVEENTELREIIQGLRGRKQAEDGILAVRRLIALDLDKSTNQPEGAQSQTAKPTLRNQLFRLLMDHAGTGYSIDELELDYRLRNDYPYEFSRSAIRNTLRRMVLAGQIKNAAGLFYVPSLVKL